MNDLCPVNESGYCVRHRTVHVGALLEWSQSDTEMGRKYRDLWDRQLAARNRGRSARFVRALWRHVRHGLPTAPPPIQEARIQICKACPELDANKMQCRLCRCSMNGLVLNKTRWARESCPKGNWPAVPGETLWARAWRAVGYALFRVKGGDLNTDPVDVQHGAGQAAIGSVKEIDKDG